MASENIALEEVITEIIVLTIAIKKLTDNNLLTIRAGENVIRILPPLNVRKIEIDQAIKIIKKVCKEIK